MSNLKVYTGGKTWGLVSMGYECYTGAMGFNLGVRYDEASLGRGWIGYLQT